MPKASEMGRIYYRPLVRFDPAQAAGALPLSATGGWLSDVEVLQRGVAARVIAATDLPQNVRAALTAAQPRRALPPRIMGIVNATPDSFSDGGTHYNVADAVAGAQAMVQAGADILDIGGESTRPGAQAVSVAMEIARTAPVIEGLRAQGYSGTISIDTRKAEVARAALAAGADMINDVSGFTHDPELAGVAARAGVQVCVMHGPFDPATMSNDPQYEDVLLDVYDFLEERIAALGAQGVKPAQIIVDPGIGFGKTQAHNLALLARLSLFHSLNAPVLLGASRKRFIGAIGKAPEPRDRIGGSIAVALAGIAQGVQLVRVHDVMQTAQAVRLWQASVTGEWNE